MEAPVQRSLTTKPSLDPAGVTEKALDGSCHLCREAVDIFLAILGAEVTHSPRHFASHLACHFACHFARHGACHVACHVAAHLTCHFVVTDGHETKRLVSVCPYNTAANLALKCLAGGGVYIAGGITPRLMSIIGPDGGVLAGPPHGVTRTGVSD